METMFRKNNETKGRKLNINEHKAMLIPDLIVKKNVTNNPKKLM